MSLIHQRVAMVVAIVAALIGACALTAGAAKAKTTPVQATGYALIDARAFLKDYVNANGQVVRHGDGADTVSEGQAYGLLLAEVADEPTTFARIWQWTAGHLQQSDGLLAWHASASGVVESTTPASDADLLTAWALSRAGGSNASTYHTQARRMAKAILADETVKQGPYLLAAGPWATGNPASLDPSYWTPAAFSALAQFTGNSRWTKLATNATLYTQHLTDDGKLLPPDWAHLNGRTVIANPAPDRSAPTVQYGLDAQRVVVWMATSCQSGDRQLAASWWRLLSPRGRAGAEALKVDGTPIATQTNALGYVAAAAAAQAAGDNTAVSSLLTKARSAQRAAPNYYGGAWLALGETLLTTGRLGGCR